LRPHGLERTPPSRRVFPSGTRREEKTSALYSA
jgi:hypothetical protein